MITTKSIYPLHEYLLLTVLNRGHQLLPGDQQLLRGESSLDQWLRYWLFNQAALVQILSETYISAMHLFFSFFVTKFVRTIWSTKKSARMFITSDHSVCRVMHNAYSVSSEVSCVNQEFSHLPRSFSVTVSS